MQCDRCQEEILDGEESNFRGQMLCEDCYIGAVQPPKTCDVAAVYSAKKHREATGQTGAEGLTELQTTIYNCIKEKGQITKEKLGKALDVPMWELERQFAVLRHCELVKAKKEAGKIYLTLFDA